MRPRRTNAKQGVRYPGFRVERSQIGPCAGRLLNYEERVKPDFVRRRVPD